LQCRGTCSSVQRGPAFTGCLLSPVSAPIPSVHCACARSAALCLQSLVISCSMSTVSGHLLYYVCSLWSSPVVCPQTLVISCTMSSVSGHLL
ncbi:unnamed protein product, partial [Staurois parvus]